MGDGSGILAFCPQTSSVQGPGVGLRGRGLQTKPRCFGLVRSKSESKLFNSSSDLNVSRLGILRVLQAPDLSDAFRNLAMAFMAGKNCRGPELRHLCWSEETPRHPGRLRDRTTTQTSRKLTALPVAGQLEPPCPCAADRPGLLLADPP